MLSNKTGIDNGWAPINYVVIVTNGDHSHVRAPQGKGYKITHISYFVVTYDLFEIILSGRIYHVIPV